jgi:hypothetical protein
MTQRGYDPSLENFDALLADAADYEPVCGDGPGILLPQPRTWMQIENQGNRPSCVGHGSSTLLEYIVFLVSMGKEVLQLNRMFAWTAAQKAGGSRPSQSAGASIHGAAKVLIETGLPLESFYPYSGSFRSEFPPEVYADAATRKALKKYELDTVEKVFDFQKSGMGGIIWGVPWEFKRGAWHCITSIGVPISDKLPVANSWGPDNGDDGWHYWDEEKTERYLGVSGSVAIGISDMDTPQVRPGWDASKGGFA